MTNDQKPPSIFQMVKTFGKELTKYIKEGAPNVTPDQYVARLNECKKCPHLIKHSMRCGLCGCLLEHKAKWKTSDCPDRPGRWKKFLNIKKSNGKR
jgi:hypothetical protein